ncbi:hypothetical protein [Anabaena azotica]|uniref:Methyl-accepting chemotaxis protein n=1 Tax=Anabaena azotica FACHB-119 TaxID=947527 RepID=A0ABR8DDP8_9NOST|nr:hypothetical protein [Anabaena azotica]MBD2505239.1 hypothetical protein [Anabaena azotica FACHB-119]
MTATITRPITRKTTKEKQESPYKRLHVIIPIEDMLWASQQRPSVNQLWQECWTSDPYGSRWMPLSTNLGYSSFICAKKILSQSGLFIFKPDKSIQDGRETVGWMVRNLHGSRMKEFWDKATAETEEPNATKQQSSAEKLEMDAIPREIRCKHKASISDESQSEQGFCEPSRTAQKHLTNSSKEIVRCVSSTPNENSHGDETAIAPLGGASPQTLEGVEEREELPTVTDCTSLSLVDGVPSQPASLLNEKQDLGVEPGTTHEGHISAAPGASGFENSVTQSDHSQPAPLLNKNQDLGDEPGTSHEGHISAAPIASGFENSVTQSKEPAGHSQPATLSAEKQDLGVEPKATHEGGGSAPSAPEPETQPDKWSSEAIALRSKARPWRMEKLKMAGLLKENPGLDFLMECWNDDPALQIVITRLVRKCPQWGYVVVDSQLMEWERE